MITDKAYFYVRPFTEQSERYRRCVKGCRDANSAHFSGQLNEPRHICVACTVLAVEAYAGSAPASGCRVHHMNEVHRCAGWFCDGVLLLIWYRHFLNNCDESFVIFFNLVFLHFCLNVLAEWEESRFSIRKDVELHLYVFLFEKCSVH